MKHLARIGCLTRSIVYFLIGLLALLVALGSSYGATTDESGVLRRLVDQPFGRFLLLALAFGLFCYAIWRISQGLEDHDLYGRTWRGLGIRFGFISSGVAHIFLGLSSLNLVFGFTKHTRMGERMVARWMLLQPYGRFFLFALGVGIVIYGFVQFLRAANGSFTRDLLLPEARENLLRAISAFGLISRGVVFVIIGSFLIQAAWKERSREAGGFHQAWETLGQMPAGNFLVGVVASGFIAFATFGLLEGFFRRRSV